MKCRHCGADVEVVTADLGGAPPSNAFLTSESLSNVELYFPLRVLVCERCWLVQTQDFAGREQFFNEDYVYFSSFSTSWLAHAKNYVDAVVTRFRLNQHSHVIEIAANDGYLLQYVRARSISCLGIEPTASTAAAARAKGIPIIEKFFGVTLAQELLARQQQADLMIANNVLAHVPDINDFVRGFAMLLTTQGVATFEFPHLLRLIAERQFDTIYHEHFSYLSLTSVCRIFETNGLSVFDVEELGTHGGSLRVFAQRTDTGRREKSPRVQQLLTLEVSSGVCTRTYYTELQLSAEQIKNDVLTFLIDAKRQKKLVVGYGAAAKGNTLLNYAGVKSDLIPFVVDRNPAKQGKYLPGSRIPVVDESALRQSRPAFVLILPWNLNSEVMEQLSYIREWGGQFAWAIPHLSVK